jgi:hypothetical protein
MIRNLKSAIQNPKSLGDSAQCAGAGGQGHQIILDFRFFDFGLGTKPASRILNWRRLMMRKGVKRKQSSMVRTFRPIIQNRQSKIQNGCTSTSHDTFFKDEVSS